MHVLTAGLCGPLTRFSLVEIVVLAGTTGAGGMAPPTSTTRRVSARMKCTQEHSSPMNELQSFHSESVGFRALHWESIIPPLLGGQGGEASLRTFGAEHVPREEQLAVRGVRVAVHAVGGGRVAAHEPDAVPRPGHAAHRCARHPGP